MKISIITINWNNAKGLKKTIESVIHQSYSDIEYVVIDGGSTDGSVEIIKQYASSINYWVSEKDGGIYDAMNKGTAQVSGTYCLYLNSGDYLYREDVVAQFAEKAATFRDVDLFSFDILFTKNEVHYNKVSSPDEITLEWYLNWALFHPATFIRTSLLKEEPYRTDYKIISDWIFFFDQLILHNVKYLHIPLVSTIYDFNGVSTTQLGKAAEERSRFLATVLPKFVIDEMVCDSIDVKMKVAKQMFNNSSYKLFKLSYKIIKFFDRFLVKKLNGLRTFLLIRFKSKNI